MHETWNDPPGDVFQFCIDGCNEERGEINGVIKEMRRGTYGKEVAESIIKVGLKNTLRRFVKCRVELMEEIGDHHYYETKLLELIDMDWDAIESHNITKLEKRIKDNSIADKGNRNT